MKLFKKTNPNGEEFLTYGNSMKEVATLMGVSPHLFKKAGWTQLKGDDYEYYRKFIVVSRVGRYGNQPVIDGPFTHEEFLKRREQSTQDDMRNSRARRKKVFQVLIEPAGNYGGWIDCLLKTTSNGQQWYTMGFMDDELPQLREAIDKYLSAKEN